MNKELTRRTRSLMQHEPSITTATVVSVDTDAQTMEVRTTLQDDDDNNTLTVSLNAVSDNSKGFIIYPAIGSDVIIGSVDGPGEYTLIRASNVDKIKVITENDSLGQWLRDLMEKLQEMTFTNGGGTTGFANNIADLTTLNTRLDLIIEA